MEKSIKRVENLVHVTNSALAQMKFSLMFDDMDEEGSRKFRCTKGFDPMFGEKFLGGDDLKECQDEFKSEANEMLAKMESILSSNERARENSKAVERIKEINKRMNTLRLEQAHVEETEQSRQKLLNLINEDKLSSGFNSSWDSGQSKRGPHFNLEKQRFEKLRSPPKKTVSVISIPKSPDKSKEELKSKILETQDIVNRGFQTARQLAQRVETMSKYERKEKTPSTEKTVSEINLKSSLGITESNESVSTCVNCRKCAKRRRRRKENGEEVEQVNARVIDIKSKEIQRCRRSNLQLQRLPSLHIKGELQLQKIHNLEIPAGGDAPSVKSNTAINFLSHEQMENEKMGEYIEKVRKENCCCTDGNAQGTYVECFNCGKLIRIRETRVDPRKVDEILKKCNFDVFDPRIDEFVEKCGAGATINGCKEVQPQDCNDGPTCDDATVGQIEISKRSEEIRPKREEKKKEEHPKKSWHTLQGLSDQLLKKYKQEAETIESTHQKLDSILKNLYRRVDESREVFESCSLFTNRKSECRTTPELTATKPVVVSLTGTSVNVRKKFRKLDKERVNNGNKSSRDSMKIKADMKKGEPCEVSRPAKLTENKKMRGRISLFYVNANEISGSERNEEIGRKVSGSLNDPRNSEKLSERGASPVMSSSTSKSWNSVQSRSVSGREDADKTPAVRSFQHENAKPSDRICRKEKIESKSIETSSFNKSKSVKSFDSKKKKVEKEKPPSESLSSSSSRSRRTDHVEIGVEKPEILPSVQNPKSEVKFTKGEIESKALPSSSITCDGKAASETSSDKSENNYESDFESMTNEQIENIEECEEEEPEVNVGSNKLSTISEVDSELEKKLSEEQKAVRGAREAEAEDASKTLEAGTKKREKDVEVSGPREGNPGVLETSTESKKTEIVSPKTGEASMKSTPTELVTSLKDILSALQDQFVRTESLAEKLTENVKLEGTGKTQSEVTAPGDAVLGRWRQPLAVGLFENLRSARKDLSNGAKAPGVTEKSTSGRSIKAAEEKVFSADSLSDEGGSSLGEIVASDRRRKTSVKSESSSVSECSFLRLDSMRKSARAASDRGEANSISVFKLEVNSDEVLYSEGEIPSEERFRANSLGEIIAKKNSANSAHRY